MNFRTEIHLSPSQFQITHPSGLVTLGSCFSDVIGLKFKEHKFEALINPFGTIFNPISLSNLIQLSLNNKDLPEESFLYTRNHWYNFLLHSSVYDSDKDKLQRKYREIASTLVEALNTAEYLIITLGTAYVYQLISNNLSVSNCHKMPSAQFAKKILSSQEITDSLKLAIQHIRKTNPNLKVLLTVSPVRHIKDTLPLNQVSKSILRVAAHQLCEQTEQVTYFPAYEIMVDDLRDYRFYKEDMIHPTAQAEEYIWQKFSNSFFSKQTQEINNTWKDTLKSIHHKPNNLQSDEHQKHIAKTIQQLEILLPYLNCSAEIDILKGQLKTNQ